MSDTSILDKFDDITKLHDGEYNSGAMAVTLNSLENRTIEGTAEEHRKRGWTDDWTDVNCPDGSKALVLKRPEKAFEIYATQWNTRFQAVVDLLNQAKVDADLETHKKIVKLFDNLSYVEATLRDMYKNAYLTFAATPCNEKSQEEKRKMDRVIAAAGLHLISFKMMLENIQTNDIDILQKEMLKLIDKITDLIIR